MENKTKEEVNIIKTKTIDFSWGIPWMAGFLFTLGYVGIPSSFETLNLFEKIMAFIIAYLIWPLTLGMKLAGR